MRAPDAPRRRWLLAASAQLALACAALAAPAPARAANPDIDGWQEAVVSVSGLSWHLRSFAGAADWRVLHKGPLSAAQRRRWRLGPETGGVQVLVGNPGAQRGHVRLVRFRGGSQRHVRAHAQSWNTGGFFDLNLRVKRMADLQTLLPSLGWHAVAEPARFRFGPFDVREWIVSSPDGLALALIERLAPPLEGWPHLRRMSRALNATQVVDDIGESLRFYREILGFDVYMRHEGASEPPGHNALGLPLNLAVDAAREMHILHPQKRNDGSVELLSYRGSVVGHDFSARAAPPNLGILMLRFPVRDLSRLAERLRRHGVEIVSGPRRVRVAPHGNARWLTVRAPSGGWLEFFETGR